MGQTIASDGAVRVNVGGANVGPDGLCCDISESGAVSLVLAKNTAPPGASVSLTNVAYVDGDLVARSAGTAITGSGLAYVSAADAALDLYITATITSGYAVVNVRPANIGGPEGSIPAADITAGQFGANTGSVGDFTFPDDLTVTDVVTCDELVATTSITGTLATAAQPNVTSVGTLTAATITTLTTGAVAGADSSLGITGQAAAQGGAIVATGGTSSTSGNAGGAVSLVGGTPGATGVGGAAAVTGAAGGATSGKGGAVNLTAGAGTAGDASGGSIILTPGAKNGSGLDGGTFNRGTFQFRKMPAPATATDTASLTDAQMTAGVIVATPTAAAAYTVRTGTQLLAALPTDIVANDAFDLTIINIGGTGDDITLTADTDITIVGDPVVRPSADSGTEQAGQGTFRFRYTGTTVFVAYRVS